MDQSRAPVLDALAQYHRLGRYGFTPPGHRQGRGIDPRVREIMGLDPSVTICSPVRGLMIGPRRAGTCSRRRS